MSPRERGPDPDDVPESETERLLVRIIAQAVREKDVQIGYQESGSSSLLKWILGVLSALAVSVIVGGVTVYGQFTAFTAKVSEWQVATDRRLDRLEGRP